MEWEVESRHDHSKCAHAAAYEVAHSDHAPPVAGAWVAAAGALAAAGRGAAPNSTSAGVAPFERDTNPPPLAADGSSGAAPSRACSGSIWGKEGERSKSGASRRKHY